MSFPCPTCGELTGNLATRGVERRRECPRGHRTTTIEISREEYDRTKHDLEYLKSLKEALAPTFQIFSKELYDSTKHPKQLTELPWFQHNT